MTIVFHCSKIIHEHESHIKKSTEVVIMFFKGAQRKVNRLKKDIFTEKGANRNHLAREIYDFINECARRSVQYQDNTD